MEIENNLPADNAVVTSDRYRKDRIFIWYKEAYRVVLYSDIVWLEADRDYCFIHFKDLSKLIVVHPLKTVLQELPWEQFTRVHRGRTVNLELVDRLVGNTIYIGKQDFLVSPAYWGNLLSRFKFLGQVKGLCKSKLSGNSK